MRITAPGRLFPPGKSSHYQAFRYMTPSCTSALGSGASKLSIKAVRAHIVRIDTTPHPLTLENCTLRRLGSPKSAPQESKVDKIRVVLADDHKAIISIVRSALGNEYEIVAAVENGRHALDAVLAFDPDVLITDISMPVLDGIQVATRLRQSSSRTKIIFLTMRQDPYFVAAALAAGVSGYVTKTTMSSDLLHAIEHALRGKTFISGRPVRENLTE